MIMLSSLVKNMKSIWKIRLIFDRILQHNMKLAPDKCSFFKSKMNYIIHIVSPEGVEINLDKTEKVVNWPNQSVRKMSGDFWDLYVISVALSSSYAEQ